MALARTFVMPFILLSWGASSLGCISWFAALVLLLPLVTEMNTVAYLSILWSLVALPLGWWNYGQFLNWFRDRPSRLDLVAASSFALIISNPFLIEGVYAG